MDGTVPLRGRPEFSQEYTEHAGGERGVNGRCRLFKNVDYDALHFHTGSLTFKHFQTTFLEGREGVTKKYSAYAFDNDDNYGRPLSGK